jgi:amidase
VRRLREAGAVVLGKTNLSEWANYVDPAMPNGFSTVGGQTRNPYGPFDCLGSSSGSAVAVAAHLAAASVGTETQGSLLRPAAASGVVALKTSRGLVSRGGIVPLLEAQDVPGPMGRTVADVAVLLTAMAGPDAEDPRTADASSLFGTDFTRCLLPEARDGIRVGVLGRAPAEVEALASAWARSGAPAAQVEAARAALAAQAGEAARVVAILRAQGFPVVLLPPEEEPPTGDVRPMLRDGFRRALDRFLGAQEPAPPVASLAEVVAGNAQDLANRAPYGQRYLEAAAACALSEEAFARRTLRFETTAAALTRNVLARHDVHVLVGIRGQAYAQAGFPALVIPSGVDAAGCPEGLVLTGDFLSEPHLLAVGAAWEQATRARRDPDLARTLESIDALSR